jgi:hypothetical protein
MPDRQGLHTPGTASRMASAAGGPTVAAQQHLLILDNAIPSRLAQPA